MCRQQTKDDAMMIEKSDSQGRCRSTLESDKRHQLPEEEHDRLLEVTKWKALLWHSVLILAGAVLMGVPPMLSEPGRMAPEEHAIPGSVYVPGRSMAHDTGANRDPIHLTHFSIHLSLEMFDF
jgi:hypothetical protein